MTKFRILSLDGGGIRGIYTGYILKRIQEKFKINLREYFDLIGGTSTGAILAASIAIDYPIEEVVTLYKEKGENIFARNCGTGYFRSKYTNKILSKELERIFSKITFEELYNKNNVNLILFATDIINGVPFVFKTPYQERFVRDNKILLKDALLASTAAPFYFKPYELNVNGTKYLLADGGLWCNNPSICLIAEAKKYFNKSLNEIKVLSIGTIDSKNYFSFENKWLRTLGGLIFWREKIVDIPLSLQSHNSFQCVDFLMDKDSFLRINSETEKVMDLDNTKKGYIENLLTIADKDFTYNFDRIKNFFEGD